MSAPEAFPVHETRRRVRLRVPSRRGDAAFFDEARRTLATTPGVLDVRTDPRTGSVLIGHDGSIAAIAAAARERGLFAWSGVGDRDVLRELGAHLRAADATLAARTNGRWSIDAIGFYILIAAGVWQATRGPFLPAGATLLMKALSMAERRDGGDLEAP